MTRSQKDRLSTIFRNITKLQLEIRNKEINECLEVAVSEIMNAFRVRVKQGRVRTYLELDVVKLALQGLADKEISYRVKLCSKSVMKIRHRYGIVRYGPRKIRNANMKEAA